MMQSISFTIPLVPVTKKNSGQIVRAGNFYKVVPSKQYQQYEKDCRWFMPSLEDPIDAPVNVQAVYYMPTRRRVDLCNLHAALHDILTHYGVLVDDNSRIIVSTDGSRVRYDKEHPRTEVTITEAEIKEADLING